MHRFGRRTLGLAIALGLVLSTIPPVTPAKALAGAPHTGEAWKVQLSGPTKVCKDEQVRYTVAITHFGVYGQPPVQELRRWGDVAGEVAVTGTPAPLTLPVRRGPTGFLVTWRTTGTYTLRATATRMPAYSPAYTPTADPDTIDVEVRECEYTIQQISIWYHLPDGWKEWVGGLVPPTPVRLDPNGQRFFIDRPFDAFAIASGACTLNFSVTGITAIISLSLPATDTLRYRISYTPGNGTAQVVCKGIPGQQLKGPISIDAIEKDQPVGDICHIICLSRAWPVVSVHQPHMAHSRTAVEGLTYVILEQR